MEKLNYYYLTTFGDDIVSHEMRCAILGDIHSNLAAFQAVLHDLESRGGFDKIWCLGDVVGYGPEPHACIELLCRYEHICVAGNHDWAAAGKINISDFNPAAAQACRWTAEQLTETDIDYLRNLPLKLCQDNFTLAHGSPRQPIWEYLISVEAARDNYAFFETDFCLVGHSHIPLVFEYISEDTCIIREVQNGASLVLGQNRLIINPGGVGQPRDSDPRASYAIFDTEARSVCHYRAEYDIGDTQRKMVERGLPESLILRLNHGW